MKKLIILTLFFSLGIFAQSLKIGIVDTEKILTNLKEYQDAQSKLNDIIKVWQGVIDSMSLEYQTKIEDYRKQESMMPDDKKTTMQKEIVKMEQDIMAYRQRKLGNKGELEQKQDELLNPIKKKIYNIIEKVAKDEKLNLVLDKAAAFYHDSNFDVTFKVLDRLNRGN